MRELYVHIRTEWFQCANRSGWLRFCGKTKLYLYMWHFVYFEDLIAAHSTRIIYRPQYTKYIWRRRNTFGVCVCGKSLAEFFWHTFYSRAYLLRLCLYCYCFLFAAHIIRICLMYATQHEILFCRMLCVCEREPFVWEKERNEAVILKSVFFFFCAFLFVG